MTASRRISRAGWCAVALLSSALLAGCATAPAPVDLFAQLQPQSQGCSAVRTPPDPVAPRKILVTDGVEPTDYRDLTLGTLGRDRDDVAADDVDEPFYVVTVFNERNVRVGSYSNGGTAYRTTVDYCVISWPERRPQRFGTVTAEAPGAVTRSPGNPERNGYGAVTPLIGTELRDAGFYRSPSS